MGDRGTVNIKDENVWLYTHWGACDLEEIVRTAMRRRQRWDDSGYLARIIFCEMVAGHESDATGFGIMGQPADEWLTIIVDCEEQTITVDGHDIKTYTFEEFVEKGD